MGALKLFAFAGFLGSQSDWDFLKGYLPNDLELCPQIVTPAGSFEKSCDVWLKSAKAEGLSEKKPGLLLGYSLGGRFAAHLALLRPDFFKGFVALSAHPGLRTNEEKLQRLKADEEKAKELLSPEKSWDDLLREWDRQPIFGGASETRQRLETPQLRSLSARQLTELSLGTQKNLTKSLIHCFVPQIWMAGEFDLKFTQVAKSLELQSQGKIKFRSVSGGSHRWPWQLSSARSGQLISEALSEVLKTSSTLGEKAGT